MNRTIFTAALTLICLATVYGVVAQRQQIAALRAQQQQIVTELAGASPDSTALPSEREGSPLEVNIPGKTPISPELLRLRAEVSRLTGQLRSLSTVTNEHARLLAELAGSRTNPDGAILPPGYIRKAQARFVGDSSPDDTLQSFLWAVQNRDRSALSQLITPSLAQQMGITSTGESAEACFESMNQLPGMAVLNRQILADGTVELEVQIAPGAPSQFFTFRSLDGHWKFSNAHFLK